MKKILLFVLLNIIALISIAQYNYLGTYTADGKPNYLTTNDVVSNATMQLIQLALPEGKPVPL
jgi:hypothetical protein